MVSHNRVGGIKHMCTIVPNGVNTGTAVPPHWKMGIMGEGNTAVQAIPSSDALVRKVGANNRYDAQL